MTTRLPSTRGENDENRYLHRERHPLRGCEQTITTLVGDVAGVHRVEPDHRTNQVMVTYDESQVDDTAIREALANSGFRAT